MLSTQIEFAVQMTCQACVSAVKECLAKTTDVELVNINLDTQSVVVKTILPVLEVKKILESTGKKVVIKGFDGNIAAVCILQSPEPSVKGVIRFSQLDNICLIDGTIDGLKPGLYEISIHESGDISEGCKNVGDIYNPAGINERVYGKMGCTEPTHNGRASFRLEDNIIKLDDIIGRAGVISTGDCKVAWGIIARSAGLFSNPKTICACDGVSLWDERSSL